MVPTALPVPRKDPARDEASGAPRAWPAAPAYGSLTSKKRKPKLDSGGGGGSHIHQSAAQKQEHPESKEGVSVTPPVLVKVHSSKPQPPIWCTVATERAEARLSAYGFFAS